MIRRLRYVLPLVLLLVPALRADAAPIFYDFTVTFNSGDLSGQSFDGSFSVDDAGCPAGVCDGIFAPLGASFFDYELLSFDITIAGESFDMSDDIAFPELPYVRFDQGNLVEMNYGGLNGPLSNLSVIVGFGANQAAYVSQEAVSVGAIGDVSQRAVPEPMTLSLLGVGLAGTAIRSRRRKSA